MNREDFEIFNSGLIYFDNAATTQKPRQVVDSIVDYYTKYTANIHRGDYDNGIKAASYYEATRTRTKEFINAREDNEIVFTKGATESLNMIVFGYMLYSLKFGDEVILNKAEHASNILPWLILSKRIGFKIVYANLDKNYNLKVEALEEKITPKTKVIALAHITNSVGDIRDLYKISKICRKNDIMLVVDATQSIGHLKTDVQRDDIDFLFFSAHKMLGPTGVGVLYGKLEYVDKIVPLEYGGGMNVDFDSLDNVSLKPLPERLEAGTRHISGVIAFKEALDYLDNIGIEKIHEYELELKRYLVQKFKELGNIEIYNEKTDSAIVLFNVTDYFSQDVSFYLNRYNICIRAGNHCTKLLKEDLLVKNTCRISLYFYNTKEEIDKVVSLLKDSNKILEVLF